VLHSDRYNIEEIFMANYRVLIASLLLAGGQIAAAQDAAPAPPQAGAAPYGAPAFGPGPAPYGGGPYNRGPYGGGPYGGGPYGGGPYGGGPYGGGPYGGGPFNNGPFGGGSPMRGVPFMQSFDMSRPDSFNPMRPRVWGRGPQTWMNPYDPKDGLSDAWDDMMNAPSRMGRVPPGWKAPTIDIPNPIDVGDEFEKNARRAPNIIRDNFTFN
jgi:hypothetical protein